MSVFEFREWIENLIPIWVCAIPFIMALGWAIYDFLSKNFK